MWIVEQFTGRHRVYPRPWQVACLRWRLQRGAPQVQAVFTEQSMFAFIHQIFRPIGGSDRNTGVPAQLLAQANALAGHDAHGASQLRSAALAALGVVR